MPNPKAIGEMTEAVILAHLILRGDGVLLPFGNNQRYDMVIDRGGDAHQGSVQDWAIAQRRREVQM